MTDDELETWSESAAQAGDAETMIVAEIALGRAWLIHLDSYALTGDQRRRVKRILRSKDPVAVARRHAERW